MKTVRCENCGERVPEDRAEKADIPARTVYYCSEKCLRVHYE